MSGFCFSSNLYACVQVASRFREELQDVIILSFLKVKVARCLMLNKHSQVKIQKSLSGSNYLEQAHIDEPNAFL
jgi:hypothetical protein